MLFFGSFLYIAVLLINAVAILSEDRFLARSPSSVTGISVAERFSLVNLSPASYDPAFGTGADATVKAKIIHLIASIRTIMRSAFPPLSLFRVRQVGAPY
ncbi:Yos1-like protein [Metarhizium album ARSEF 1941]|uniref:Yos1-like protein n=1 Tax=Metarhizium album (strain ARSEF 1941) TaxID=1081103 RepID=A0A0B2WLF8_METAS|nr:Yos1-like protein [Metarhizium album ARSEF 1941]KHN93855.1 Yos1-like protein [Metarhizium album ARSEF 1941]